jgi:uncharacterized SAM-binding protein YcdF (DUF218 family)
MKKDSTSSPLQNPLSLLQSQNRLRRLKGFVRIGVGFAVGWFLTIWLSLWVASSKPVDAVLVLGGSIQREIYAADLAKQSPTVPILISQGSSDPCVRSVFQHAQAPMMQVWLEKCARSTFDNFWFNIPTLRRWKANHVKLVTSSSHLPRAKWIAQILLGAHGVWVEPDIVVEKGVPGNREFAWKTGLDMTRSLVGAIVSQAYAPKCSNIVRLSDVDLKVWSQQGFHCEHRASS